VLADEPTGNLDSKTGGAHDLRYVVFVRKPGMIYSLVETGLECAMILVARF